MSKNEHTVRCPECGRIFEVNEDNCELVGTQTIVVYCDCGAEFLRN